MPARDRRSILLAQLCCGFGCDDGVIENKLDIALERVAAGQLDYAGQQERSGLLAVDALLLALGNRLLDGSVDDSLDPSRTARGWDW